MNFLQYPLHADFADGLILAGLARNYPVWRFMQLQATNNSTVVTVADEANTTRYTGGRWLPSHRLNVLQLVQIANANDVRGWFCIPHTADDELINHMASIITSMCRQRPIIEFSNEVWNGAYRQHSYAKSKGNWIEWYARQTEKIKIAAGDAADVVASGQFWYYDLSHQIYDAVGGFVDLFAVAPYYARKAGQRKFSTVAELTEYSRSEIVNEIAPLVRRYADMVIGSKLTAYEVGFHGVTQDTTQQRIYADFVNREGAGLCSYLLRSEWRRNGGGAVYCPYGLAYPNGERGEFWGHVDMRNGEYVPAMRL